MLQKLVQIWKIPDLRKNILFILAMLVIFRLAAHIPVPGINIENLKKFFESNEILGLLNILSGGSMENFSVVMLGVAPYITASIIFQLLIMIIPRLEELSKEEYGRQKINQWTRILTVPMAVLNAYGMIAMFRQSATPIITDTSPWRLFLTILTITAGTIFLMWIGELISEKKMGNGISLLIFAGIVAGLPSAVQQALVVFDPSQILNFAIFAVIAIVTIVSVVVITEGRRQIPVSYAKRVRGTRMYGGMSTHLPLRVNMAGVIPVIFAISVILFPPMIAQFFLQAKTVWVAGAAQWVIDIFNNQLIYGLLYFILVFGFTYFYTAVIFHPHQIAENLQKNGGFIPGIRPGAPTADYLGTTTSRIILAGALFLAVIAILPMGLQQITGVQALAFDGISVLIAVSVVIETIRQIDSQLTMREYEKL
jgi:preprotein translocase subunit SecY